MRNVTLDEQHLVDIAYAIRDKSGIPHGTPIMEISKTPNVTDKDTADTSGGYGNGRKLFDTATIPGASAIQVELTIHTESTTYDYLQILPGTVTTAAGFSGATKYGGTKKTTQVLTFENTDTISFYFCSDSSNCSFFGYYAEVTGLDADGRLITDGVPSTTFRPCDMAAAIAGIVAGDDGDGTSALECIAVTGVSDISIGYSYDLSSFLDEDFIYLNWIVNSSSSVLDYAQGFIYRANGSTEALAFGNNPLTTTSATAAKARGVFTDGRLELHANGSSYRVQQTGYVIKGGGGTIGIVPEGELQITKNGTYDVTDYATTTVEIPSSGITPEGTLDITENGEHIVTTYDKVNVNVASSGGGDSADTDLALLLMGANPWDDAVMDFYEDRITNVAPYAFYQKPFAGTITLPNVITIQTYGFGGMNIKLLKHFVAPNLKRVEDYAFQMDYYLEDITLDNVIYLGANAFYYCEKLTDIKLPSITEFYSIGGQFRNCTGLKKLDLGASYTGSIPARFVNGCSSLEALILRNASGVCTLANVNAIQSSGIASGTGYIYVPSALVDSYKAASNWSTYAAQFRAIEDYPEICG